MKKGILVASDRNIEWLLPWWWKYYSKYNNYPVAFVDLGMSDPMKKWCEEKGQVISLAADVDVRENKEAHLVERHRKAWFKKPFACLQTPFDLTLWLDVDCEVCEPLDRLFGQWEPGVQLAVARENKNTIEYNSGVLLFPKEASFLQEWARLCLEKNENYISDQNALTELLLEENIPFRELDQIYNWMMVEEFPGFHASIVIAHWCGKTKEHIRRFGGLHDLVERNNEGFIKTHLKEMIT
jgi:hypothetical protein